MRPGTATGKLPVDRTFVRIPHTDNLFVVYNKYQEEAQRSSEKEHTDTAHERIAEPMISFPEENISVYSRSLICRMDEYGKMVDLQEDDIEAVKDIIKI